jgi:hypothetical protein
MGRSARPQTVPDLTFFADRDVDRVLGVAMELAAEVYVLRERVLRLEQLLEGSGTLTRADLDAQAANLAERDAFIERVLAPMTYEADSPDPSFEPA